MFAKLEIAPDSQDDQQHAPQIRERRLFPPGVQVIVLVLLGVGHFVTHPCNATSRFLTDSEMSGSRYPIALMVAPTGGRYRLPVARYPDAR